MKSGELMVLCGADARYELFMITEDLGGAGLIYCGFYL